MKSADRSTPAPRIIRRDQGVEQRHDDDHDPYRASARPPEPTSCPRCHATFVHGRWSWSQAPAESHHQVCPACQRIQDHFPAGYVTIKGAFFAENRDEILALLRSHEEREKAERPLQRIMAIDEKRDVVEVTTTDSQLARGLAEALHDAYKGDLKLRYSRDENLLRATWKR
jgi:hypothetical protein